MTRTLRALALTCLLLAILATAGRLPAQPKPKDQALSAERIIAEAEKTADAQLAALKGKTPIDWVGGTLYAGLAELSHVSRKPDYVAAVRSMGKNIRWTPLEKRGGPGDRFHADDYCIGQAILDVYAAERDPAVGKPLQRRLEGQVEDLKAVAGAKHLRWSWCDALFMAPPGLARMSAITGARKYIDAMDKEWWRVTAALYDSREHLFYRDGRFLSQKTKNGKKVFWSRGNGWVFAGMARVLTYMPRDYPTRDRYVKLFGEMASRLAELQEPSGLWPVSLLDPAEYPGLEFSGTAFYCYGFAWGVNNGLLDRGRYLPSAARAWAGLLAARRPDALPGYVQPIGESPRPARPQETQLYATGGFLLAACVLQKLPPIPQVPPLDLGPAGGKQSADRKAPSAPLPGAKAFVRHVPERMDDVAWENDRIAFRLYGPALEKHEPTGSGIDVWCKSTRRLIINDWYRRDDYHRDYGEGLDFYAVGQSRGCGGLGIWDGGKLHVSRVWESHKILRAGPDEASFQLTYAPWDVNGRKVWEHRTITLPAGSNLNRMESTIESKTRGDLVVGIGIARRQGKGKLLTSKEQGIFAYWQPPEKPGTIGCAVLVNPSSIVGFTQDPLNHLVLIKATPGKPFIYYAGAYWSKSGDFKDEGAWEKYLRTFPRK
jgi:rhamnogalacturonyl hydrolase YesR